MKPRQFSEIRTAAEIISLLFLRLPFAGLAFKIVADPDPAPIIVAGSLYLVGEARSLLLSRRLEDA